MERVSSNSNESTDDSSESSSSERRSPGKVIVEWLRDRAQMIEHEGRDEDDHESDDDDEDDSAEKTKTKRIGRTLRGLFRKHVEKTSVEDDSASSLPERTLFGGVVAVDAAEQHEPVYTPQPEVGATETPQPEEGVNEPSEELVKAVEEEPILPKSKEHTDEEPDREEDVVSPDEATAPSNETTAGEATADSSDEKDKATTPVAAPLTGGGAAGSGSGTSGSGGGRPPMPPVPPSAALGSPGARGLGYNAGPVPHPLIIERERVVERRGSNVLPVALIGAEFLARRRQDRKIRERIEEESKQAEKLQRVAQERIDRLESEQSRQQSQMAQAAKERAVQTPYKKRPIAESAPKEESRPAPLERTVESKPQPIGEILSQSRTEQAKEKSPTPSIAELERTHQMPPKEQYQNKDILEVAEQLATRANERAISHETFDERWHEIKDVSDDAQSSGSSDVLLGDTSLPSRGMQSQQQSVTQPISPEFMVDPSRKSSQNDNKKIPVSGLWTALVVGVVVALIVIITSLA